MSSAQSHSTWASSLTLCLTSVRLWKWLVSQKTGLPGIMKWISNWKLIPEPPVLLHLPVDRQETVESSQIGTRLQFRMDFRPMFSIQDKKLLQWSTHKVSWTASFLELSYMWLTLNWMTLNSTEIPSLTKRWPTKRVCPGGVPTTSRVLSRTK